MSNPQNGYCVPVFKTGCPSRGHTFQLSREPRPRHGSEAREAVRGDFWCIQLFVVSQRRIERLFHGRGTWVQVLTDADLDLRFDSHAV